MLSEYDVLCGRLKNLVNDAADILDKQNESREQLSATRAAVSRLNRSSVSIPQEISDLLQRLEGEESGERTITAGMEHLYSRLRSLLDQLTPYNKQPVETTSDTIISEPLYSSVMRHTPQEKFAPIILEILREMNGSAQVEDVINAVHDRMSSDLIAGDYEIHEPSGEPMWRYSARRAGLKMATKNGILSSDSPNGIWELAYNANVDDD